MRPLEHFISQPLIDDSFYSFTIARNIAEGRGITIDGENKTNGFQPLVTFLLAVFFYFISNNVFAIRAFLLFSILIALATSYLIYKLVFKYTKSLNFSLCVALFYFFSYRTIYQDMNGLETGLQVGVGLLAFYFYLILLEKKKRGMEYILGLTLGILSLVRIDMTILVVLLFVFHILKFRDKKSLKEAFTFSIIPFLMVLPWFIYNYIYFGSIIPTSGRSQMFLVNWEKNFHFGVRSLFSIPFFEIMEAIFWESGNLWIAVFFLLLYLIGNFFIAKYVKGKLHFIKDMMLISYLFLISFFIIYVPFFPYWFLDRYLFFPLHLYYIFLAVFIYYFGKGNRYFNRLKLVASIYLIVCIVLFSYQAYVIYSDFNNGYYHMAMYLKKHYPQLKKGILQSGIAGFFCSKVVNLDGKVNYQAYLSRNKMAKYVEKEKIELLADRSDIIDRFVTKNRLDKKFKKVYSWYFNVYLRKK